MFSSIRVIRLATMESVDFSDVPRTAVALGNFDGVHGAHRLLLAATCRHAKVPPLLATAVFCFDPPSSLFLTDGKAEQLSTLEEKLSVFSACGIEYAYLADFQALRHLSPEQFVSDVLKTICHAEATICGFHFRFGQNGCGDAADLRRWMGEDCVTIVPPYCVPIGEQHQTTVLSSTVIRQALASGDVASANRLLGHPYSFTAPVVRGKQLGRKLGTPTINQFAPKNKLFPAAGVYATRVYVDGTSYMGVSNVGVHPTVDRDAALNCETYLLGFHREIYGKTVTVEFLKNLRKEARFSCIDDLQVAIEGDIRKTKEYFNTL